jgi:hypothetical protein
VNVTAEAARNGIRGWLMESILSAAVKAVQRSSAIQTDRHYLSIDREYGRDGRVIDVFEAFY